MADVLYNLGKKEGANGILAETNNIRLVDSSDNVLSTVGSLTAADFTVATDGTVTNDNDLDFTIGSEDVTETADAVMFASGEFALNRVDLDTSTLLSTEGTATISAGDLSWRL